MSVPAATAASRFTWETYGVSHLTRKVDFTLAALTLGRLSLVPVIILSFMAVPVVTIGAIALFVATDIFDGVFARSRNADGPDRRALDSTVDRIGIDAGIVGAYVAGLLPAYLLVALLARDAYCAFICSRMMYRRRVAIKADWMYRGLNMCIAVGAIVAPFVSADLWVSLAGLVLILSIGVAADLTRSVRRVESSPPALCNAVLSAGTLRRSSAL